MPYDGSTLSHVKTSLPLNHILKLQDDGWSANKIAKWIGFSKAAVSDAAKRAGSPFVLKRSDVIGPKPALKSMSRGLYEALVTSPLGHCTYIALDIDNPEAKPCNEPCCDVEVVGCRKKRISSWCANHHVVVYPKERVMRGVRFVDGERM